MQLRSRASHFLRRALHFDGRDCRGLAICTDKDLAASAPLNHDMPVEQSQILWPTTLSLAPRTVCVSTRRAAHHFRTPVNVDSMGVIAAIVAATLVWT